VDAGAGTGGGVVAELAETLAASSFISRSIAFESEESIPEMRIASSFFFSSGCIVMFSGTFMHAHNAH